jgi:menaquinone-specific isochorismate synthase
MTTRALWIWLHRYIRAFASAGIVAESIPEHELAETAMKFRPIVEAFA